MAIQPSIKNTLEIMKKLLTVLLLIFSIGLSAQETLSLENPIVNIENKKYTLIDIDRMGLATVKYEEFSEGKLLSSGLYFNNKPHGVWKLYEGKNVTASILYNNGNKISYMIINNNEKKIIKYVNNRPSSVIVETSLALN